MAKILSILRVKYLDASFLFSKSQEAYHRCQRRRRPLQRRGSSLASQISAAVPLRQIRSLLFESDVYENPSYSCNSVSALNSWTGRREQVTLTDILSLN